VPESFDKLLRELGAQVEFHTTFADHHNFTLGDIDRFMSRCVNRGIEMIVTTEKDAVRFPFPSEPDVPIYFLRIEVKILNGEEVWERCIERICTRAAKGPEDWSEEHLLKGDTIS